MTTWAGGQAGDSLTDAGEAVPRKQAIHKLIRADNLRMLSVQHPELPVP